MRDQKLKDEAGKEARSWRVLCAQLWHLGFILRALRGVERFNLNSINRNSLVAQLFRDLAFVTAVPWVRSLAPELPHAPGLPPPKKKGEYRYIIPARSIWLQGREQAGEGLEVPSPLKNEKRRKGSLAVLDLPFGPPDCIVLSQGSEFLSESPLQRASVPAPITTHSLSPPCREVGSESQWYYAILEFLYTLPTYL